MRIEQFDFGTTKDGVLVKGYRLKNADHLSISVINWGATLISVKTPDRNGIVEEITLGFDTFKDYEDHSPYFGSTVGRVANRIKGGCFDLDGVQYQMEKNENGINHLHGGKKGISKVVWEIETENATDSASIRCKYFSKDGEEGYPGDLSIEMTFTLTESNDLIFDYQATTTKTCPLNLTNHAYWNLSGGKKRSVLNHELQLNCDAFLPVDDHLIPTGEIKPVAGTPWDFRKARSIGKEIEQAGGYDHCYVFRRDRGDCEQIATVLEPISGREMIVYTTEPGVQFYSGNFLHRKEKQGFKIHDGLCLETQFFPNAVNQESFPSILLKPGEFYSQKTIHRFSTKLAD
ncbi:galactose mutarotase [bacterium]|nr:galactose mutarotase [bacterium]